MKRGALPWIKSASSGAALILFRALPEFADSKVWFLCSDILSWMRPRFPGTVVTIVLAVCLVCPLVETFDNWDHTIQTGNDTEYTLVVLALCVGVAYSFARLIFKSAQLRFLAQSVFASCPQKSFFSAPCSFTLLPFDATSPPPLPLRI